MDDRHRKRHLPEPCLDGPTHLMVDEKAVRNHHGYVAFVLNAANGEPLYPSDNAVADLNQARVGQVAVQLAGVMAL